MSRAKPYRSKPTRDFMIYYDIALQSRYYLIQENGPTRITLEASNQKKYKINVGSDISCSCGGGRTEHCVHTIYALLKIFRIDEGDPLLWQLSFTETEIDKILERREKQILRNRQGYRDWQSYANNIGDQYREAQRLLREDEGYRDRNAQLNLNTNDLRTDADEGMATIGNTGIRIGGKKEKAARAEVPPRPLEDDETCCVCCDNLRETEDLSHCIYGCGRQIHTDCLRRCFKHNLSNSKPLQCPLCRTNWGPTGLDRLNENSKRFREKKKETVKQERKAVGQIVGGAVQGQYSKTTEEGKQENDRGFKCSCCKRQLIYEAKYQCMICEDIQICKLCFNVKYHKDHEFLVRPGPDKDWEPAPRDDFGKDNNEYRKIMEELQTRELGPNDYDLLLKLENQKTSISLQRFLALGFEKANPPPPEYFAFPKVYCAFCEAEILDRDAGLQLKQCNHHVHKACLHDIFTLGNKCPLCDQKIALGYEVCLNIPKMKKNRVIKKKEDVNANLNRALQEQAEKNIAMQFGIAGTGINMEESKTSVVGRRDLFAVPGSGSKPPIAGGRGARVPQSGRPPIQNRKTPNRTNNFKHNAADEEEKQLSGLSAGDFNLAGTQIGSSVTNFTSASSTNQKSSNQGRLANGASFRNTRAQSQNNRVPTFNNQEESKGLDPGSLEVGGSAFSTGNASNKHRLTRDIQEYRGTEEREYDFLDEQQERFEQRLEQIMMDKKVKESIRKHEKEKKMAQVKKLGANAPLNKYYREQVQQNAMDINVNGLQLQGQGSATGAVTQTTMGTGLTPRNVLQQSGQRIGGNSNKGSIRQGPVTTNNFNRQRMGSAGRMRQTETEDLGLSIGRRDAPRTNERINNKKVHSVPRKQISNLRAPPSNQQPVNSNQLQNFAGSLSGMGMGMNQRAGRTNRPAGGNLANCGLIANSIPLDEIEMPGNRNMQNQPSFGLDRVFGGSNLIDQ